MKQLIPILLCFFLIPTFAFGQYTFEGKVIDEAGEALIFASIQVKKTQIGTVTDIDGTFKLNHSDSVLMLVVNYTGYTSQEVEVVYHEPILVQLATGIQLEEVVVTGLGISKEKKALGYGVNTIKGSKARKRWEVRSNKERMAMQSSPSSVQSQTASPPKANKPIIIRGHPSINYQNVDKNPIHPDLDESDNYGSIQENPFYQVAKDPLSTFSIDVDAASYSNLRRFINNGQKPPIDAVRIEEMINYFDYDYPQPKGKYPFEVVTEISDCPWNKQHRLVHIGLQGKKVETNELPASNLVFLLDVSGSMHAANKLPLLQASLNLLINNLRSRDKVAIVVYAGAAGTVLPATKGTDKQKIRAAINQLRAGGSTAGATGIQLAYKIAKENFIKEGNNRVILATDGDFNVGVSSNEALVKLIEKERKSGVFLTVLGFGEGNYQDHKMQELADKGNGNHAYIDNILEAKKVLVKEFGGTLFTIAKDVKLQIEFNPAKIQNYRLIGYENRILAAEDFNNDLKDAGELGAGHTVTALYEVIPTGVKSVFSNSIDPLKYQANQTPKVANSSKEMMTIKLRYKQPDGDKSQLIEKPVLDNQVALKKTSDNFRFSAAVAEFGLLLRDSDYKNKATFEQAIQLAKKAKGKDENGYRAELIRLIEMAELMHGGVIAEKE